MTEQELRMLVRQAIAHHTGHQPPTRTVAESPVTFHSRHPSAALFALSSGPGGSCVIEPSVQCTHCGFCKTYGH
jgi:hypothetical protein